MDTVFQTYFDSLLRVPLEQKTEHTDRAALEVLLCHFAGRSAVVQHEPRRQDDKGSPDFKITVKGAVLGYIEVKKIGDNLDAVLKSPQIKKYRQLSDNILLTDYLTFIWISSHGVEQGSLAFSGDVKSRKHKVNTDRADLVGRLLRGFFSQAPMGLGRAQELAAALATRSHLLREGLAAVLADQEAHHQEGRLYGLYAAFRTQVFADLTLSEFADAFAQMLAYGLFLARLNTAETITLDNARQFVPGAFPLIRELIDFIGELRKPDYTPIRWLVEEILSIMNSLDLAAVLEDLSFANRRAIRRGVRAGSEAEHRLFERDPFVYFYEDFLARYDAKLRKSRGVYYTPPPVVNFIIRAIDTVLRDSFGITDGLADHKRVTLLDFATGTGTFLLEALEKMFETIGPSHAKRVMLVREHVLRNVFGFEYLIAPYTIAHLKLSQYLKDKGVGLTGHERLGIYLTNTLEPIAAQQNFLLPALSKEADVAQEIKDKPILVITGNPPYSGHSRNNGVDAKRSIDAYKIVDGARLAERNSKWLNDDYVKFIRFAQMKIDAAEEGIVGIITNHSFLDNPTFRGMRQSLMVSFNKIYVLDLHGNAKKNQRNPDGSKDENVFDIEQGVAVSLFVKSRKPTNHSVYRADLFGTRSAKYEACARTEFSDINWKVVVPSAPFYLFQINDVNRQAEYQMGWSVSEIFPVNVLGFQTHRDEFAIGFTEEEIAERLRDMADQRISDANVAEKYKLKDNRDWKLSDTRKSIQRLADPKITVINYRPFDQRFCHFGYITMDYPRRELLAHVHTKQNICILVPRQIGTNVWRHAFLADAPANDCLISNRSREANYVYPLYLYPLPKSAQTTTLDFIEPNDKTAEVIENIAPRYRDELITRYENPAFSPEQIFGYVYAVLHSQTYRDRYSEFLRGDFPRIPFAGRRIGFETLADLGWDLAQIHLLKVKPNKNLAQYQGRGDNVVEKPRYVAAESAVYINAAQFFAPVPENVWAFQIGGYQVLEKYLKSRKGRALGLDEVTQVERIVAALEMTIERMAEIDIAYRAAFGVG
ncbi:hypothetical protein ACOSOMT5_P1637 [Acidiphilium sp. MT5]